MYKQMERDLPSGYNPLGLSGHLLDKCPFSLHIKHVANGISSKFDEKIYNTSISIKVVLKFGFQFLVCWFPTELQNYTIINYL